MALPPLPTNLLAGSVVVVSLTLAVLAIRTWRYARDRGTLLLAAAFLLFLAKGMVIIWGLFALDQHEQLVLWVLGFDLAILVSLYLGSLG